MILKTLRIMALLWLSVILCQNSMANTDSNNLAIGENAISDNGSVAIGNNTNSSGNSVSIGTNSNSDVASISIGKDSTAVNLGVSVGHQATSGQVSVSIGFQSKASGDSSVALGASSEAVKDSIAIGWASSAKQDGSLTIGHMASTDGQEAIALGRSSKATDPYAIALGSYSKATGYRSLALGYSTKSTEESVAIGGISKASNYSVAIGSNTVSTSYQSVALGYNSVADRENTISVGNSSKNYTRQITNVKAGTQDTDAVNFSQLNKVKTDLTNQINKLGEKVNENTTNINNGVLNSDFNELKDSVIQNKNDIASINTQINDIKTNGAGSALIQNNPSDKTVKANANASNSLAIGSGSQAKADNSIALGTNSIADRENTVSIGSKGNERQITNVQAGTQDTDAVNFSQLKQVQTSQNAFEKSTNLKFQSVYERMEQNQKENRSGISSAMAMGAIPQAFQYGTGLMGMGVANYKGETALAVGISRVSENGHWVTKLNGSANSNDDLAISFGIGYAW